MSSRRFAILACLLSLLLHCVVFWIASRIPVDGAAFSDLTPKQSVQEYQAIHLSKANDPATEDALAPKWEDGEGFEVPEFQDLAKETPLALDPLDRQEERLRQSSEEVRKLLEARTPSEEPVTLYSLDSVPAQPEALPQPTAPTALDLPKTAPVLTAPRPEIFEIRAEELPADRLTDARILRPELDRIFVDPEIDLPSMVAVGELAGPPPTTRNAALQLHAPRPQFGLSDEDYTALYGDTADTPENGAPLTGGLPALAIPQRIPGAALPEGVLEESVPLDDAVDVKVFIYPDTAGASGTFLVEIRPGPRSAAMADIPKDVLFILDRSSSISPQKFAQFKAAVQEVFPALDSRDRFNIVSFNDRQSAAFRHFVPGTPANLAEAQKRVGALPHGGKTDVFGGVAPFVRQSNGDRTRPLNLFLLTDGQSTVNLYEPSKFLRQISDINPGNVSIFPFSAERKANRLLLDFLGYLNKGEKCHVESTAEIREAMVRFYNDHSSLIVTDMRCAATGGADVNEIFPRSLPHLYRNQTLRLFGRYENRAETLTLAITGRDAQRRLRDLVFQRKLDECPIGEPTLPAQWAAQKILFLLARRNLTDNAAERAALTQRINALKEQYSILSPY